MNIINSAGGIISSTGFKISGDTTNEHFLDDDGAGNHTSILFKWYN